MTVSAPTSRARATTASTGWTTPVTLLACWKATTRVRSPTTSAMLSGIRRPASSIAIQRSVAPVRAARICHGMRLAWCSDSVTTIWSPGPSANRAAASPPMPWDALPMPEATRLSAAVAFSAQTICSGEAPTNAPTVARARSNASVASSESRCAPRATAPLLRR